MVIFSGKMTYCEFFQNFLKMICSWEKLKIEKLVFAVRKKLKGDGVNLTSDSSSAQKNTSDTIYGMSSSGYIFFVWRCNGLRKTLCM